MAIYLAIVVASAALPVLVLESPSTWIHGAVLVLLALQVLYRVLTAFTVRRALRNPVVLSNLGIAGVHAITITAIILML